MLLNNVVVLLQYKALHLYAHTLTDCFILGLIICLTLFICNNLTGHSDVVMGLVSVNREDLYDKLKFLQNGE